MEISSIFMVISLAKTRFYIVKQTVSTVCAFFEQVWTTNGFGIHFGPILGTFWHIFSIFFRHRFSDAFLGAENLEKKRNLEDFGRILDQKL